MSAGFLLKATWANEYRTAVSEGFPANSSVLLRLHSTLGPFVLLRSASEFGAPGMVISATLCVLPRSPDCIIRLKGGLAS